MASSSSGVPWSPVTNTRPQGLGSPLSLLSLTNSLVLTLYSFWLRATSPQIWCLVTVPGAAWPNYCSLWPILVLPPPASWSDIRSSTPRHKHTDTLRADIYWYWLSWLIKISECTVKLTLVGPGKRFNLYCNRSRKDNTRQREKKEGRKYLWAIAFILWFTSSFQRFWQNHPFWYCKDLVCNAFKHIREAYSPCCTKLNFDGTVSVHEHHKSKKIRFYYSFMFYV